MPDYDISLGVDPSGAEEGYKRHDKAAQASGRAAKELAKELAAQQRATREAAKAAEQLAKQQARLADKKAAEAARERARTLADERRAAEAAARAVEQLAKQREREAKAAAAEKAASERSMAALKARTAAIQQAIQAARAGENAQRALANAIELVKALEARRAQPGTDRARQIEAEIKQQQRLKEELRQLAAAQDKTRGSTDRLRDAKEKLARQIDRLKSSVFNLRTAFASLGLAVLIRQGLETASAFDSAEKSLSAVTGTAERGFAEMQFVRREAERLGLQVLDTARQYSIFTAAVKDSNLEGQQAREIFSAVGEAGAILGLNADQMQGIFYAIGQMVSKGTVNAEELRQQLGDRLPAAVQIMARATGVSVAELGKLMAAGKVISVNVLPRFQEELRKTFGTNSQTQIESMRAKLTRFGNALTELRAGFGQGFFEGFFQGLSGSQDRLGTDELIQSAHMLGETLGGVLGNLTQAAIFLAEHLGIVAAIIAQIVGFKLAAWIMATASAFKAAAAAAGGYAAALRSVNLWALAVGAALAVIAYMWGRAAQAKAEYEAQQKAIDDESREYIGHLQELESRTYKLEEAERKLIQTRLDGMRVLQAQLELDLEAERARAEQRIFDANVWGVVLTEAEQENAVANDPLVAQLEKRHARVKFFAEQIQGELDRLAKAPEFKPEPPDLKGESTEKKLAKIREQYRLQAEAAKQLAAAQQLENDERAKQIIHIEAQREAREAALRVDKASAEQKKQLAIDVYNLLLQEKDAEQQRARTAAAQQAEIDADAAYRQSLAARADAIAGTNKASIETAARLQAESEAREQNRLSDEAWVASRAQVIATRETERVAAEREIAVIERGIAQEQELRQLKASLADAISRTTAAVKAATLQATIENELRQDGIALGSKEAEQRAKRIRDIQLEKDRLAGLTATQARWNATRDEVKGIDAATSDWQAATAAANQYGDAIAGILGEADLLGDATAKLHQEERLRAALAEEGLDQNNELHAARIQQVKQELAAQDAAIAGAKKYQAQLKLTAYVMQGIQEAWKSTTQTLVDAAAQWIAGVEVNFKDLMRQLLVMWVRTLAEMVARAAAANLAARAVGGGGKSGAGSGGGTSLTGAGSAAASAYSSSSGTALTASQAGWAAAGVTLAAFAAVYFGVSQWIKTNRPEWAALTIGGTSAGLSYNLANNKGGTKKSLAALTKMVDQFLAGLKGFFEGVGATFTNLEYGVVEIGRRGQGSSTNYWVKLANGVVETFGKDAEAAYNFALVQAIKNAETRGLDPLVAEAIRQSAARTVEQLQQELAPLYKLSQIGLPQEIAGIRSTVQDFDAMAVALSRLREVTPDVIAGWNRLAAAEIEAWTSVYDAITGREQTAEEQLQLQQQKAKLFNAEKALRIADLRAQEADLVAKEATTRARADLLARGLELDGAGLNAGHALIQAKATLVSAEVQLSNQAMTVVEAQLAAIRQVITALQNLPDIDPATVRVPTRGGGGGRRQARADFEDELERIAQGTAGEAVQRVRDLADQIEDLQRRARETGASTDLLNRAIARLREEESLRYEGIVEDAVRGTPLTGFAERLREVRDRYADLRAANEESLATTGKLIIARWKLNAAESAEAARIGQDALSRLEQIGGGNSVVDQIAETVELLAFLNENMAALALTEEQILAARDQAAQALLLSVAENLARAAGNETELRRLADLRWRLEKAGMLQQIRMLEAQAEILGLSADDIANLYDLYNQLPDKAPDTGSDRGGRDGDSGSDPRAAARDEALRLLERYEQAAQTSGLTQGQERLIQIRKDFETIFAAIGRNSRTLAAWRAAIEDLNRSILDRVRELRESIEGGSLGGATSGAQVDAMMQQAQALWDTFRNGDELARVGAAERLLELLPQLLQTAEGAGGGGRYTLAIQQFVLQILRAIEAAGLVDTGTPRQGGTPAPSPVVAGPPPIANVRFAGGSFLPAAPPPSAPATDRLVGSLERLVSVLQAGAVRDSGEERLLALQEVAGTLKSIDRKGPLSPRPVLRKAAR